MRGFAALGSAVLLLASCSVYDSSLKAHGALGNGGSAGASGSAGSGGGGSPSGGATSCTLKSPPSPPVNKDLGGETEIVAIQSDIDLGDSAPAMASMNRYLNIGFDLDGVCSTAPNITRCTLPADSSGALDGPGGIDNAMGFIIQKVREFVTQFSSEIYTSQLMQGAANAIIHVTGYNGLPDDDKVRVEALVSAPFNAFDPNATPKWDGTDTWPVAGDSVKQGDIKQPVNVDPNAYVTNNQLVATLPDGGFRLLIGLTKAWKVNLTLHLHNAFVVCNVEKTTSGAFTLKKCTLAGRWNADELLEEVWRFPDPIDLQHPRPLCTDASSYPSFKSYICSSRDILWQPSQGPTYPCDALSFGTTFNTVPGKLGNVYNVDTTALRCRADNDPANDSCEAEGGVARPPAGTGGSGAGGSAGAGGGGASGASGASAGRGGAADAGPDATKP